MTQEVETGNGNRNYCQEKTEVGKTENDRRDEGNNNSQGKGERDNHRRDHTNKLGTFNVEKTQSNRRYSIDMDASEEHNKKVCWWETLGECVYEDDCWYSNKTEKQSEEEQEPPNTLSSNVNKVHSGYYKSKLKTAGDIEKNPGPMLENRKIKTNAKKSAHITEHRTYHKNKLMLAGDIEKNPGPKQSRNTEYGKLLIKIVILLLPVILLVIESKEVQDQQKNQTIQQQSLNSIGNLLNLTQRKHKKTPPEIKSKSHIMVILLIIAGDVHINPGPIDEANVSNSTLVCESCHQVYHLNTTMDSNAQKTTANHSFQWICPNISCKPNYSPRKVTNSDTTPNRYRTLQNENSQTIKKDKCHTKKQPTLSSQRKKTKVKTKKASKYQDYPLLEHLTTITVKDYIGKEICRKCNTDIGCAQKAISCDSCDRWTHYKCSDMTAKNYNKNKNLCFSWVCNTCRRPETMKKGKLDVTKLKPEQIPISNESLFEIAQGKFLILHYNCRSYLSKLEELHNICYNLQPSIICLTETWLDSSTGQRGFIPNGYNIIRHDRTEEFKQKYGKSNGGGVAVLFKKELKVKRIINSTQLDETLWLEVKAKRKFTLGIVYRADYTNLLTDEGNGTILEDQLNEVTRKENRVIVVGDFNCDTEAKSPDTKTKTLKEVFDSHSMTQLIRKPTRIDQTTNKATTIDHVWTTEESKLISDAGTVDGISDHTGIYTIVNTRKEKIEPEKITYRCFKDYSQQNFNDELAQALEDPYLKELLDTEQPSEATDQFTKIFLDIAQKHAPVREKLIKEKKKQAPWFTSELQELMKEKTKWLKLYWLDGYFKDLKIVKSITNKITHLKRNLKRTFYRDKIHEYEGDAKNMWKVLKEITQTENKSLYTEPDNLDQNLADTFNRYFATIGTNIQMKLGVKEKGRCKIVRDEFKFREESEETIMKLIERIRSDVAVGFDNMNARLLKDSKHIIVAIVTKLVNISYKKSKFPNSMKKAIVRAIHKKDNTEEPTNYRPLSILPVLSKVFERSATDQLLTYLEENRLLNEIQHAYRKYHSTQTCLSDIVNYIYRENDQGNLVGIASLDLSKAFDTINHSHLLHKLTKLGLGTNSLNWCESYLTGRTQRTKFKHYKSKEETVTAGVPQGSILGPVLFISFTNDLPESFPNCKIMSYADDTQLLVSAKTTKQIKKLLENIIHAAQLWYTKNGLLINASKTEVMIVSKRKITENVHLEIKEEGKTKKLELQKSIKILGIHLDNELNWNKQVNAVNKKAKFSVHNLCRVNHLLPLKTCLILYNSLVASHFNYTDTVWGGCSKKNKNKLQRTQNAAVKSMIGMSKRDSTSEALEKAHLLPLEEKRKIHEGVYTKKALSGNLPTAICRQYNQQQSTMNNRSSSRKILTIPKHKTEHYKNSPFYRTITTWNSIPQEIKVAETSTFKKKYQAHITSTYKH